MKRRHKGRKAERNTGDAVNEIMTLHEVADYLKIYYYTLYRLVRRGAFPAFRLGGDFRVRRADLDKWIAQRHVRSTETQGCPENVRAKLT
jgi:excisionase family DNA binding protein